MQILYSCRFILSLARIMILRNGILWTQRKSSISGRISDRFTGTLMISIIFALIVYEGIKYLRQIRRDMYNL